MRISLCAICLLMLSCTAPSTDLIQIERQLLHGDWVSDTSASRLSEVQYLFSFEDSVGSFPFSGRELVQYDLRKDTLSFTLNEPGSTGQPHVLYRILHLDEYTLRLVQLKNELPQYIIGGDVETYDTITLTKVSRQNSIVPKKILFASTTCFGSCPSMALSLYANGDVKFLGKAYTQQSGGYKGKLTGMYHERVLRQLHNLPPPGSLDTFYSVSRTDQAFKALKIITDSKTYQVGTYGHGNEPYQLTLLLQSLMELYKFSDLNRDTTVSEDHEMNKMLFSLLPTPPSE